MLMKMRKLNSVMGLATSLGVTDNESLDFLDFKLS